jgi:enoyl-CoA hydratase/carnithine racemase
MKRPQRQGFVKPPAGPGQAHEVVSAAMTDAPAVSVDLAAHVATVEIHRPPHNWFDIAVMTELADAILGLDDVDECRAVVLCSEGRNFCAGADLKGSDLLDATTTLYEQAARLFSNRKPIVAAVQGAAVGGGLGLSLAADFRVASPETRFTCNFAKLGFHQGFGISATLPAIVGQQHALELMYTAVDVRGEEALRIGLADRLVPADELRAAAHAFAAEIATSAPLALLSIRETMRGSLADQVRAATARENQEQQRLRETADFQEGVAATAERRPPNFTGR